MNESNSVYNTIKDCTYYLNPINHHKYIKIWALDNYEDDVQEQLCKQLEADELINIPSKQSTIANNVHTYNTHRPFRVTYPDERNYGNEYENVYDNTYKDILEPFDGIYYNSYNWIVVVAFIILVSLAYCKYILI